MARDLTFSLGEPYDQTHILVSRDELVELDAGIAAALARVEAETRRQFEDERAALRAVLTPLREVESYLLYAAPQRCGRCVRGFSPGCPCNPTCHTRDDNFRAALSTVRATINALAPEVAATDAPGGSVRAGEEG